MSDGNGSLVTAIFGSLAVGVGSALRPVGVAIAETIRGRFRPDEIRGQAEAEADARITRVEGDIRERQLLRLEALERLADEEAYYQSNMRKIARDAMEIAQAELAISGANQVAIPSNDWLRNFFRHARYAGDDDVRKLWSKILAGEIKQPGRFSKRTIAFLETAETKDLQLLNHLYRLTFFLDRPIPVVIGLTQVLNITEEREDRIVDQLQAVGLLMHRNSAHKDHVATYVEPIKARYFDTVVEFWQGNNSYPQSPTFGGWEFTTVGRELVLLCEGLPVPNLLEVLFREHWAHFDMRISQAS